MKAQIIPVGARMSVVFMLDILVPVSFQAFFKAPPLRYSAHNGSQSSSCPPERLPMDLLR